MPTRAPMPYDKLNYSAELASLFPSCIGGRATTAAAGGRAGGGGINSAVRLLRAQQEDLERLLHQYDTSLMRSVRLVSRATAGPGRRAAQADAAAAATDAAARRADGARLRRLCASVDSARRAEEDEAAAQGGGRRDRHGTQARGRRPQAPRPAPGESCPPCIRSRACIILLVY